MDPITRYHNACAALAASADIADKLNDPSYVADRSARATILRAEQFKAELAEYRAAVAQLGEHTQ